MYYLGLLVNRVWCCYFLSDDQVTCDLAFSIPEYWITISFVMAVFELE
jgi:hypothetical protein